MKDILKVQLDRLTNKRLDEYIRFLQAKISDQKVFHAKSLLDLSKFPYITQQMLVNYAHNNIKEGLTFLDCFDIQKQNLIAIHESCYEVFAGAYEAFILSYLPKKLLLVQSDLLKDIINKINDLKNFSKFSAEGNDKIQIIYEMGRNFNEFPFNCFLKYENMSLFKKKLFEGLKSLNLTLVEEKYIPTSIHEQLFPSGYKSSGFQEELIKSNTFVLVPENNKYSIWGLWRDHIRVVLRTKPSSFYNDLLEIFEILSKISDIFGGGYKFHKNFGYLAENALDLGSNTRFSLETQLENKKNDVLKQFCKTINWNLEEKKAHDNDKVNVKVSLRKPNIFIEELDLLNNLIKALVEN